MRHLTLHIEGMSCGHCLNTVNQALAAIPGVNVESVRIGRAELRYDEQAVDPVRITDTVTGAGYPATLGS